MMRLRRRTRRRLLWTGLVFLCFALFSWWGWWTLSLNEKEPSPLQEAERVMPLAFDENPLSLDEYVKVRVGVAPGKVYLVDNCTAIVMMTSLSKTYSIQRGLEHTLDVRPDAYDLVFDLMDSYDIAVKLVKISRLNEGIYHAQLFVQHEEEMLNLDSKPTDALAIASRFNVPVYVKGELLQRQGERVC
jgi:bifunctional DNase/RNase